MGSKVKPPQIAEAVPISTDTEYEVEELEQGTEELDINEGKCLIVFSCFSSSGSGDKETSVLIVYIKHCYVHLL